MKIISATLVCLSLVWSASLAGQESAQSIAEEIVESLSRRSSLPRVKERARIEAASLEVCQLLAKEFPSLSAETRSSLVDAIAQSTNSRAHAVLVAGLAGSEKELSTRCLQALSTLDYKSIRALPKLAEQLDPGILGRLAEHESWHPALRAHIRDLCMKSGDAVDVEGDRKRALATTLFADLVDESHAFQQIVDELLQAYVSVDITDIMPAKPSDEEKANRPDRGQKEVVDPRIEKFRKERIGALDTLRSILVVDLDIQFALNMAQPFQRRNEIAEGFWKRFAQLHELNTPEGEEFVFSWRQHLNKATRAVGGEERIMVYIVQDELCGGVKIPRPESEKSSDLKKADESKEDGNTKPGENDEEAESVAIEIDSNSDEVPCFWGANIYKKVEHFNGIKDRRDGQRPRIRAVKKAFQELYLS